MDGTDKARDKAGAAAHPLFSDPPSPDLHRVGVVDVGSNSVRLVVFDGAARSPAYFYNEKIMCGLGAGMAATGRLNREGRARALKALRRFAALADAMGIGPLTGVATAAVREAEDGPAFRDQVEAETGLSLRIISGAEEAQLSAQGVLLGRPTAQGLVCDIGGSSMELAELAGGRPGRCLTSPLGPLRLDAVPGGKRAQIRHIDQVMADLRRQLDGAYDTLHLVGGSWRAIARLDMERRRWPLRVLHEYAFSPDEARATLDWVEAGDAEAVRGAAGVSSDRMALVPKAAPVLRALLDAFVPSEIAMSSYGLREGLLYEAMPAVLRDRDPLIEAARFAEATSSRLPGFGKVLYQFLLPLYADAPHSRLRLIRAACLLHDTAWRAHPDYRAELCFDNATRANLGGITHPERVFLGLALMHRYKNLKSGSFDAVADLVSDADRRDAEILGKAMRFGAILSVSAPERMGVLKHHPQAGRVELVLGPAARDLFGEVVMTRFEALARAMGCEPEVTLRADPAATATRP
ncbi:MAG TPA: exopolyphosphatase [Rhodobacteraceae bacterium]|jgi:exopolyphosphatase/guanosine-5'-triphosphate,3'-diphosphate pyrophosphatase|nr:Ppx/GppA family phosphatase [Paracoccaceae bacterium]HBG98172.1 exopolyphosphatase [Paracoccaceae bacterium]